MGKKIKDNLSIIISVVLCLVTIFTITASQGKQRGEIETKVENNIKSIEKIDMLNREDHKIITENQRLMREDQLKILGNIEIIRKYIAKGE